MIGLLVNFELLFILGVLNFIIKYTVNVFKGFLLSFLCFPSADKCSVVMSKIEGIPWVTLRISPGTVRYYWCFIF